MEPLIGRLKCPGCHQMYDVKETTLDTIGEHVARHQTVVLPSSTADRRLWVLDRLIAQNDRAEEK